MNRRFIYFSGAITLLGVFLLSVLWEFYLEDIFIPLFEHHHEPESLFERWEYVITAVVFAGLAVGASSFISLRLIAMIARRDKELEESEERYRTSILRTFFD